MDGTAPAGAPAGSDAQWGTTMTRATIRETFETILVALAVFLVLQASVQNFRVEGYSMQPTLDDSQHLLVNKLVYLRLPTGIGGRLLAKDDAERSEPAFAFHGPERGDVIVFRPPNTVGPDYVPLVKRVIGVPGDVVAMNRGVVHIDGLAVGEPYITHQDRYNLDSFEVPEESVFVLGDNRPVSEDSRGLGAVPWENIVGKAWFSFWPLDQWRSLTGTDGPAAP